MSDNNIDPAPMRCFVVGQHTLDKRWATATNGFGTSFTLPVLHCAQCNRMWCGSRLIGTDEVRGQELDAKLWLLCGPPRYADVEGWPR